MKQFFEIVDVTARSVVDLDMNLTVEVDVTLDDGTVGRAAAPGCMKNAKAVNIAVDNVNIELSEALLAMNALEQASIDALLMEIDGTPGAARLGANAVLAVSLAVAKAAAESSGLALYNYIGGVNARMIPEAEQEGAALSLTDYTTLTGFIDAAASLRGRGGELAVTALPGEPDDTAIADIAVALNAERIVTSSAAVMNQLTRIEEELFDASRHPEEEGI